MLGVLATIWTFVNSPIGISLVGGALAWVAVKLGIIGDLKTRQVLALAGLLAEQMPSSPWVDYFTALLAEMNRRGMGEPTGPQVNAVMRAWEAMGGEKPTPRIVSNAYQNGTKVPSVKK